MKKILTGDKFQGVPVTVIPQRSSGYVRTHLFPKIGRDAACVLRPLPGLFEVIYLPGFFQSKDPHFAFRACCQSLN